MSDIARIFIIAGIIFLILGVVFTFLGKMPWIGKLPGDIFIKKENFSFYFPLTTCLLLSVLLSLIFFLFNRR